MPQIRINTPGMASTDPGYISSVTIYTAGSATVLVPNATTGEVTVDAPAASKLCLDVSRIIYAGP
jgi:hypothetical protein